MFSTRPLLLLVLSISCCALPASGQSGPLTTALDTARAHTQRGLQAYRDSAYTAYRTHMATAIELRPGHPTLLYHLARASALTDAESEALTLLDRLANMGMITTLREDDALDGLPDAALDTLQAQFDRNAEPVVHSRTAFGLPDSTFIPEGLAFDPQTQTFYVGSVRTRQIVQVDSTGHVTPFASADDGLWSVLGMAVDAPRRLLWVCTTAMPQTHNLAEADHERAALLAFDLETGQRVHHIVLSETGHNLNDLTLAADGTVYITDAVKGGVFRLPPGGDELEAVLPAGTLSSPQGLCLGTDPDILFIADYALGLLRLDLRTNDVIALRPPPNATVLGIDGLDCHGGDLIAVQNGVRPHRVIRVETDEQAIQGVEVLEAANPRFAEPTLGRVVEDRFYFVANSYWPAFAEDGSLNPEAALTPPLVLELDLN